MSLSPKTRQKLIASAHELHPIVIIGNRGLTASVLAETDRALTDHELIKVKIGAESREERLEMAEKLSNELSASCLRIIGHIAIVYRKNDVKP